MTTESHATSQSISVNRLRFAMGTLTVVLVVSFIAVGAIAPAVVCAIIGGAITAFLSPSRTVPIVLAGLVGLVVFGLVVAMLIGEAGDSWGDQVFLIGGGALSIATIALAVMALGSQRRS